jgi:glycine cleavage system H protein
MNIPSELKYTLSDDWVKIDGSIATIGVTDYAQSELSDIVFIEFKVDIGEQIKKGQVVVNLESVKAVGEVKAPISGKVVVMNELLLNDNSLINQDPYGKAWVLQVEFSNPVELGSLLDAVGYQKCIEERSH